MCAFHFELDRIVIESLRGFDLICFLLFIWLSENWENLNEETIDQRPRHLADWFMLMPPLYDLMSLVITLLRFVLFDSSFLFFFFFSVSLLLSFLWWWYMTCLIQLRAKRVKFLQFVEGACLFKSYLFLLEHIPRWRKSLVKLSETCKNYNALELELELNEYLQG